MLFRIYDYYLCRYAHVVICTFEKGSTFTYWPVGYFADLWFLQIKLGKSVKYETSGL